MIKTSVTLTDRQRLEKFMRLLPEQEFNAYLDELKEATMRAHSSLSVVEAINVSKEKLGRFDNEVLKSKHLLFIEALDHLRNYVGNNFSCGTSNDYYELLPEKRGSSGGVEKEESDTKYAELCAWVANTKGKYDDFLEAVRVVSTAGIQQQNITQEQQILPKIKLSDYEISFDEKTAQLKVGDLCAVDFPPFKNEYYIMKELFAQRKCIVVDWDVLHEAMSGGDSEAMAAIEPHKQKKAVQDAIRAINKRVKNKCNTDDDLLKPEIHSIKRLY